MCMVLNASAANPPSWEDGLGGKDQLNTRCWRPGEPLDWVRPGLIDSLIEEGFDYFHITAESTRKKGYNKGACYMRQDSLEVLFIEGDMRYICYDPVNRTNSSQSVVVGYNYYSLPYWYNGELCFQNGQSNWYRHSHRHFHSRQNGQLEMRATGPAPNGVDQSLVFAGDSASYFITFLGKLEESEKPALVFTLPHRSQDWIYLGKLHPSIQRLRNWTRTYTLKDYWVFTYDSFATVIRKHDLAITQVPSKVAISHKAKVESSALSPNKWQAIKGNTFYYNWNGTTVIENFDESVVGAQWKPLFVPFDLPSKAPSSEAQPNLSYLVALLLGGIGGAFLLRGMRASRRPKTTLTKAPIDPGQPTPMLLMLMSRRGELLSTHALDQLFDHHHVASSETRRSKRSRTIQMINMESTARYGGDIIHRERSDVDKRVMNYRIELDETA